jgi:hypothetical protein
MTLRRAAVATTAAVLLLAAPAAASSTAAAGPSPTPLILELILAAVVMTGMAVRRPLSRALRAVRRTITAPRSRATARARARV